MKNNTKNNICIVGSGVVGSATGNGFRNIGKDVIFFDVDSKRIENMKKEGIPATTDFKLAARESNVFFLCVPTPDKDQQIDLSIIDTAVKNLATLCKDKEEYFLVVAKSTIVPMTTENRIIPMLEKYSGKKVGADFGVCFNPEFLREENPLKDFLSPDRIVIGQYDKKSGDMLYELYSDFMCPIVRTDLKTAEMAKYANNCFYAAKISYFNELDMICREIGINSVTIRKIVQMDKYYGTHPWNHGHSFGGKCIPKDLNALIGLVNHGGIHEPTLLKAVRKVNEEIDQANNVANGVKNT
jgi:UDPglucose 6-dehydrogenase